MPDCVRVLARAKVNLFLRVGPRRADGYHDLETVFHAIELADTVEIRRVTGTAVTLACRLDVPAEKNLAMRAARLFLAKAGEERVGLAIQLEKRIPVGAGLGGGSADAAAVLVGLNALLDTPFEVDELCAMGRALGADVPFCVTGGMAEGRGIGDRLRRLTPSVFDVVVVKPPVAVSTPWAYGALDAQTGQGIAGDLEDVLETIARDGVAALAAYVGNDFERVVLPAHPEIARARDVLGEEGAAWAMMSGSGAAVFGVFEDAGAAARGRARVAERLPACEVHQTRGAKLGAEVLV